MRSLAGILAFLALGAAANAAEPVVAASSAEQRAMLESDDSLPGDGGARFARVAAEGTMHTSAI